MSLSLVGSVRSCVKRAAAVAVGLCTVFASGGAWAGTLYVSLSGDDETGTGAEGKPYYSLEKAVSVAAEGDTVRIAPGVYNPRSEITLDKPITISGGSGVFLNGASLSTEVRFMIIDHADAVVDGICFSNKSYTVNNTSARRRGIAVQVKQGTLKNSIVAKCSYKGYQNDGVLSNEGGTITDCEVTGCTGDGFYQTYGVGFRQTAGTTTRIKVNKCSPLATWGCGVVLSGGVIDGAIIEENGKSWMQSGGTVGAGVWMDGGELKNSIVRNNINQSAVSGVYVAGSGKVTNCEIIGNVTYDIENAGTPVAGLFVDSTKASVTDSVITNNALAYQPYPDHYVKTGATFENNTVQTFAQTAVKAYVSENGSNEYPYDTEEKAARSVNDALNALCRDDDTLVDLYIGEGTFEVDNVMILKYGVRIHGKGRDKTTLAGHGSSSKKCRGFYLANDNALVEDLTLYNIYYSYYGAAGSGAGAKMSKGTIRNVWFKSCSLQDAYQYAVVYMTGGLLESCEISDAYDKWSYSADGEGLCVAGGLATNCVIHSCTRGDYAANGGHGVYVKGGTLDSCVISNNGVSTGCNVAGSGLRLSSGVVRNSLITDNKSKTGTAGVYIGGGTFENNTVVGNVTASDTTGQSGATINGSAAIVRNNIFYGNGGTGSTVGSVNYTSGTLQTNIIDKIVAGTGNINANPSFDAQYRPQLGSPAIDKAAPVAEVTHDLVGLARPNGDGPDIGCYEFDWSKVGFTAKISIAQNDYPADGETAAVASSVVVGAKGTVTYAWYLDDGEEPVSTEATFSSAELTAGRHALRLVVTCGGQTSEDAAPNAFDIHPFATFAGPGGSNTYPYDTAAKSAHCLNDAVAALWSGADAQTTVTVGEGVVTSSDAIVIHRALRIVGAGKGKSFLNGLWAGYQGFVLNHDGALLENLCISNFSYAAQAERGCGAGVKLSKGTVRNCQITKCRTHGAYQSGSAIYLTGGLVMDCEIDHCEHQWAFDSAGNAVYQTGGTVTNCWIHSNPTPCQHGGSGASVLGGLMTHCLITHNGTTESWNGCSAGDGSGAYVGGSGVLRNCIVRDNTNSTMCAGVAVVGGRVEHCTIYNNNASSTSTANSGLIQSDGTVVNSIVYGNGSAYASIGSLVLTGGTFATNLIDVANGSAIGCTVADPGFVDAAANDLHLKLGSAAINKGAVLLDEDYDFDGVLRDEKPDLGAYEYVSAGGPLSAGIVIDQTDHPAGATLSATATAEGKCLTGLGYAWYVNKSEEVASTQETLVIENAAAGLYALRLVVTNDDEERCVVTNETAFNVHPYTTFAATNGASIYPYDTWAKAATNVADAFQTVWSGETESNRVVTIAAGTYPLTDTFALDRAISVIGAGKDLVFLEGKDLGKRGAILASDGALLQGVTIRNVKHAAGSGVGVNMSKGTLRDVRVTGCRPMAHSISGVGLYMSGGLAEDCDISGNDGASYMYNSSAVGACVVGGTFRNGSVSRNTYSGDFDSNNCVGLYVGGGLVENVMVVSNAHKRAAGAIGRGAVRVTGGTLRNALIWGNWSTKTSDADGIGLIVDGSSARIENCTVVGNRGAGKGVLMNSGKMYNTIVADNANGDMTVGAQAEVFYSRWSELTAERNHNTAAEPRFRSAARGDWRLKRSSPCVDKGTWQALGATKDEVKATKDLRGARRLVGEDVDMGCCENPLDGLMLLVR